MSGRIVGFQPQGRLVKVPGLFEKQLVFQQIGDVKVDFRRVRGQFQGATQLLPAPAGDGRPRRGCDPG